LPMRERRLQIAIILGIVGELRAAYNYAVVVGEPLHEELTRVQTYILYVLASSIRMSHAMTTGPGPVEAWRTTFFGIVSSLSERDKYSDSQVAALASALAAHYPVISRILGDADKSDLRKRIAKLLAVEKNPVIRSAYAELLRVTDASGAPSHSRRSGSASELPLWR
jgi:hypothetical protein